MKKEFLKEIEPTLLTDEELLKPANAILQVFDSIEPETLRRNFWECLKAASSDRLFSYRNEPLIVYSVQKDLGRLCDALFLMLMDYEENHGEIQVEKSNELKRAMSG